MKRTKGVCLVCSKEFDRPEQAYNKIYCSPACATKSWKLRNREKYLESGNKYNKKYRRLHKAKPVKKICPVCHQRFLADIHTPFQIFCNYKCRNKWCRIVNRDAVLKQKKAERIKHKKKYQDSNDFYHNKIRFGGNRHLALERDEYKCVKCGKDRTEVRLVVHHKDGRGPSRPNPNHELTNLVTMCRSCHRKAHDILAT